MPASKQLDPGASPMHFFGAEVRRARLGAGMTLNDLGARVPCDASTVSRIEGGVLSPTERFAEACDEAFPQMGGWFTRFYLDSRKWDGPHPPWFRPFVEYEMAARALRWYEPLVVPGLLQVEGYAREVLRGAQPDASDEEIERQVEARLDRQKILSRDNPPHYWVVIDQGVLYRKISDSKTMCDQLWHMAQMADRPKTSVQVIPFEAGARTGLLGHFVIADLGDTSSIVYLETAITGQVVEAPSVVSQASLTFDTLRSEALPRAASKNLIMKVAEDRWT